jgi:3-hydroxyacyl-[acyl-carrier-protein] dehydratase
MGQNARQESGLSAMDEQAPAEANPERDFVAAADGVLDIKGIMHAIPHRYPFLLIDRVVDMIPGESATGIKNVSVNEPFFAGHFPNHPVMPGVMIIESMAQTSAVLVVTTLGPEAAGKVVYFMSIDGAKFRRPVLPGDQMRVQVTRKQRRGPVWKFEGIAKVDGAIVAEAVYSAMIMDRAAPI